MEQKLFECLSLFIEAEKGGLANINFSVESGKVLAIMVPNQAERTNLLKSILGTIDLQSGSIRMCGEECSKLSLSNRLELGLQALLTNDEEKSLISDTRILRESFLGYAKIRMNDLWSNLPWMGERKSFTRFKRTHRIYRKGPQAPRLLIATLYQSSVPVDKQMQRQFLYTVMELKSRGTAVLLLTNELSDILTIADQICIVKHGRVVALVNNEERLHTVLKNWERQEPLGREIR